jgi:hypothetical protein
MDKEILIDDDASIFWRVTDNQSVWFEVKCGIHKLLRFETFEAAKAHYERWAPEAHNDWLTFDQ